MKTRNFLSIFNAIETVINNAVRMIVNIFAFAITEIAPMVAPLPPAFSIYLAMSQRLHVPLAVAVVAAIAIEIIGMFSSKVSIRCYQWNMTRNKTEPTIPQTLSVLMTGSYFAVVLLLALTVELLPGLIALIIPGFVLIAISVYVNLAIHTNLEKLEIDKAAKIDLREEKNGLAAQVRAAKKDLSALTDQAKRGRQTLTTLARELTAKEQEKIVLENSLAGLKDKVKVGQNGPNWPEKLTAAGQTDLNRANEVRQDKISTRRQKLASLLSQDSQLTNPELAAKLDVSIGTIKNDKKALNGSLIK